MYCIILILIVNQTKNIATALVTSKIDYGISLVHNIAIKDITKLLCRVQNCLGRAVTRSHIVSCF